MIKIELSLTLIALHTHIQGTHDRHSSRSSSTIFARSLVVRNLLRK
jgi:hypothetical protein